MICHHTKLCDITMSGVVEGDLSPHQALWYHIESYQTHVVCINDILVFIIYSFKEDNEYNIVCKMCWCSNFQKDIAAMFRFSELA